MTPNVTPAGEVADGPAPEWMTTRQLAEYLQISWGHTRKLVADQTIRSTKITGGKRVPRRIHKTWADAYLQARASGGITPGPAKQHVKRAAKSA